jgi:hypothetical protein
MSETKRGDASDHDGAPALEATQRPLSAAARRALQEAEERRSRRPAAARPNEVGGRDGPEPVRFGDWEVKGLACDF